jgi:hypothetical protein
MSKASDYAKLKKTMEFCIDEYTGACVKIGTNGHLVMGFNGFISLPPEKALHLAKWLLDVFGEVGN